MLRLTSRGKSTEAGDRDAVRSEAAVTFPRLSMAGSDFTPARRATGSRAIAELTRSSIRRQLARIDRLRRQGELELFGAKKQGALRI